MIREAILHFDPLQTQVKTECIDQNGLRSVKFIDNEDKYDNGVELLLYSFRMMFEGV